MTENSEEAIAKEFDELKMITAACLKNAEDLLKSAKTLIDQKVDHICYHLAALALEEIGKITLLRMRFGSRAAGKTERLATPVIDDHIKKLFWALWGPMFGQTRITKEQIDEWKGIASSIHSTRLRSLYVDPASPLLPAEKITHEETTQLIDLVEARVGMQAEEGALIFDESTAELSTWFIDATDDPAKRNYIFGSESLDKLAELKSPRKWIEWLHERSVKFEKQARELLEREFNRPPPSGAEAEEKRWRIRIRLYSASHSIHAKTLRKWNETSTHIFLYPTKRKDEMVCELNLENQLAMKNLWTGLWEVSRLFVLSLNIATSGFFWWHLPREIDSLYDEIFDLENKREAKVREADKFKDNWHHLVLKEESIRRIKSLMLYILGIVGTDEEQPLLHYSVGMTLLAKSDPQMNFYVNAFLEFFQTLKAALYVNKHWDGTEDLKKGAQRGFVDEKVGIVELGEYLQLGVDVEQGRRFDQIGSKQIIQMKEFCDTYFLIRTVEKQRGIRM